MKKVLVIMLAVLAGTVSAEVDVSLSASANIGFSTDAADGGGSHKAEINARKDNEAEASVILDTGSGLSFEFRFTAGAERGALRYIAGYEGPNYGFRAEAQHGLWGEAEGKLDGTVSGDVDGSGSLEGTAGGSLETGFAGAFGTLAAEELWGWYDFLDGQLRLDAAWRGRELTDWAVTDIVADFLDDKFNDVNLEAVKGASGGHANLAALRDGVAQLVTGGFPGANNVVIPDLFPRAYSEELYDGFFQTNYGNMEEKAGVRLGYSPSFLEGFYAGWFIPLDFSGGNKFADDSLRWSAFGLKYETGGFGASAQVRLLGKNDEAANLHLAVLYKFNDRLTAKADFQALAMGLADPLMSTAAQVEFVIIPPIMGAGIKLGVGDFKDKWFGMARKPTSFDFPLNVPPGMGPFPDQGDVDIPGIPLGRLFAAGFQFNTAVVPFHYYLYFRLEPQTVIGIGDANKSIKRFDLLIALHFNFNGTGAEWEPENGLRFDYNYQLDMDANKPTRNRCTFSFYWSL